MKRRIVYRKTNGPIIRENPSWKYEYTNQIFEDGEWKFFNRYTGKFGKRPIVWYDTLEWAKRCGPKDSEVEEIVEYK